MKCPGCTKETAKVSVLGMDESWRCPGCGGVWTVGWVINSLAEGKGLRIEEVKIKNGNKKAADKYLCPEDGSLLQKGEGDGLPQVVEMWKCGKCKHWFLPGNSIFELAKAFEVKAEYRRLWKRGGPVTAFVLPVVLTVVMVLGLGMIVAVIQSRQQIQSVAASPVSGKISVVYLGDNRAEIRFMTRGEIETALYRREQDDQWQEAMMLSQGQWKAIIVSGVNLGEKLWLSLDERVFRLTVGQKQ